MKMKTPIKFKEYIWLVKTILFKSDTSTIL